MISRVRRGMRGPSLHTDDWLITYADMITLLLCFFVVLFITWSSRSNTQREVSAPIASAPMPVASPQATEVLPKVEMQPNLAPFVERDMTFHGFDEVDHPIERIADEVAIKIGRALPAPNVIEPPGVAVVAPTKSSAEPTAASRVTPIAAEVVDNPEPDSTSDIEPKSDRITTLEMSSSAFFDSGSAKLSDNGKSILRELAEELRSDRYEGYQVTVEGHTDDTPISTRQFSSNWELSTARAAVVVRFFLDRSIPAQKLRAAGYADTYPKVPNRDANGKAIPENQAQNRRVVIKLEKIEKSG
jgi:flagellar motor protein MotB